MPVPFSLGVPGLDLFPLKQWVKLQARVWRRFSAQMLHDGYEAGWPPLREAIASHLSLSRGLRCDPAQIFVVTGSQAGLDLILRALEPFGRTAWIEDPGYFNAREIWQPYNIEAVPVPVDGCGLDVAAGLRAAPDALMAIATPSAQFPTCAEMSPDRREALLEWSLREQSWIIEDDYLGDVRAMHSPLPPLAADRSAQRVIYLNSFNRTMFPALRLGYVVVPPPLIDNFLRARRAIDSFCNVPNQVVLTEFMSLGLLDEHLIRSRAAYGERRAALLSIAREELAEHLSIDEGRDGLHLVGRSRLLSETDFARKALEAGIRLNWSGQFSSRPPPEPQIFLGFPAFTPPTLIRAARQLGKALERRL